MKSVSGNKSKNLSSLLISILILASSIISLQGATAATTNCTVANSTKCTVTFSYSGSPETFTVPSGITRIDFDVRGAQGGNGTRGVGGQGGIDTGTLVVVPGQNLVIRVGGQGSTGNSAQGGFNGGGLTSATGGSLPGSGGGASDIRLNVDTLNARIVVAGGGGGASGYCTSATGGNGGAGGGLVGANGGGSTGCWASDQYGRGGSQSAGGAKGSYSGFTNTAGSLGAGGRGNGNGDGGGGGGGGYYGGGGGLVESGGGGSSFLDTNTARSAYVSVGYLVQGGNTGNGLITLSYLNLVPAAITLNVGTNISFGITSTLTITSDSPGKVTFFANGKRIPKCISITLGGVSPNFTGQCFYKPAFRGSVSLSAEITPSDSRLPSKSSPMSVSISNRKSNR